MAGNGWTPGAWHARGLVVRVTGRGIVALCPRPPDGGVSECIGNANLIAAAPELANACSRVVWLSNDPDAPPHLMAEAVEWAKAALRKARGDQPDSDPPIPNSATPQGA